MPSLCRHGLLVTRGWLANAIGLLDRMLTPALRLTQGAISAPTFTIRLWLTFSF